MFLDPLYMLILLVAGGLSLWASFLTRSRFKHYARIGASSGMTGEQAARAMLNHEGLHEVGIERVGGFLSDHYDPRSRVLRLSPDVHDGRSLSAIGVACHEAGHALQHAQQYAPLSLRSTLVPAASIGSNLSPYILMLGLFMGAGGKTVMLAGIILLAASVLFTLVTLPVEYDASARARSHIVMAGIVTPQEEPDVGRVLNAAFLTYLAAAISAVMTLVYWLLRSGLLGGRDD